MYLDRMQEAIEFIESNLTESITLQQIAQAAAFSPYHFHRIFHAVTGISVAAYIRRRRLSHAAYDLLTTGIPIIEIAVKYQFDSQESFTRAFKKVFGVTPARFRTERRPAGFYVRKVVDLRVRKNTGGIPMIYKVAEMEEFHVIGLELQNLPLPGTPHHDPTVIPKLWDEFLPRIVEIENGLDKKLSFGMCFPSGEPVSFHYAACVPVTSTDTIPQGMMARTIPANKYAVFTHKGPTSTISETFRNIYENWLPQLGYELAPGPDFELYDERFTTPDDPESETDIYIPIR